ncbi:MAG: hypothetical protein AAF684_03985 [Pseudomonadota bacterium]
MRALKVAVAVMGVMIVFGTIALIVVIAQRAASLGAPQSFETVTATAADGRVHLLQRDPDGRERLLTLDADTGAVLTVGPVIDAD